MPQPQPILPAQPATRRRLRPSPLAPALPLALGWTLLALGVASADWPQWRGPLGTGVAPEADPPVTWSESANVRWKTPIPGFGTSTPILWKDLVFLLTATKADESTATPTPASTPRGGRGPGRRGTAPGRGAHPPLPFPGTGPRPDHRSDPLDPHRRRRTPPRGSPSRPRLRLRLAGHRRFGPDRLVRVARRLRPQSGRRDSVESPARPNADPECLRRRSLPGPPWRHRGRPVGP
jgi:hypothetical protein